MAKRGRPYHDWYTVATLKEMRDKGMRVKDICNELDISVSTYHKKMGQTKMIEKATMKIAMEVDNSINDFIVQSVDFCGKERNIKVNAEMIAEAVEKKLVYDVRIDALTETLRKAMREAGKLKMKAKKDGDTLKQERFYGMELAYIEALSCVGTLEELE